MSKRAEEAALKAYPVYGKWIGNQYGDWDNDINSTLRKVYLQGYEQAEKDTNPQEQPEFFDLEKAARHVYESWMGGTMDEVRRDMDELGKVLNARKEDK